MASIDESRPSTSAAPYPCTPIADQRGPRHAHLTVATVGVGDHDDAFVARDRNGIIKPGAIHNLFAAVIRNSHRSSQLWMDSHKIWGPRIGAEHRVLRRLSFWILVLTPGVQTGRPGYPVPDQ